MNKSNSVAQALRIVGILIIIFGVIGSIFLASSVYYEFNMFIFLVGAMSTGLSGALVIGFSEVIQILHENREYLKAILQKSPATDYRTEEMAIASISEELPEI